MKRSTIFAIIFILSVATVAAPSARDFAMPALVPATSMASRDVHAQEKLAFAADPYDSARKASIFHPALLQHEVLPVLVVFTNDGEQSVNLANARFELVTRDRAKAEPYSMDDLRRVLTSIRAPNSRAQDKLPVPVPGKDTVHGGLSNRDRDELQHAMFSVRSVEPHSSRQGFLFFDVTDLDNPAQGARLYATGVTDEKGHELMYFEVELAPAAPTPTEHGEQ
jgi:hypothetical protein